jgi:excisionase family DNA binding protein
LSVKSPAQSAPLLVTTQEAARQLSIGKTKLYELINSGELHTVKIGGSRRVPVRSIERYALRLEGEL